MKSTAGAADCLGMAVSSSKKDDAQKRRRRGHKGALQLHHLPLDTLSDMMSLLSFKEAVRMSLLSSQWRHLWKSCIRDLVFTRETMCCATTTTMSREEHDREAFIRNVECVLCQLDPTTPRDKFVLEFKLINTNVQAHVDRWVTFCAASRAKHIVFDFKPGSWGKHDNSFSFPLHLFIDGAPAVRSSCLMFAYLNPLPGFCGFTNLRKLKLDSVSGDIQGLLLPSCSMLEWLSIVRCTLRSLTTSQPLRQLRYLCVHYCFHVHRLEVQAPNLNTFMYDSLEVHPVPFMLDGCVELQEVTIKFPTWRGDLFDYAFADHGMANVPKLSVELAIDAEVPGCAKCPGKFVNLKHLILSVDVLARDSCTSGILRLACLLELSPILKHLELHNTQSLTKCDIPVPLFFYLSKYPSPFVLLSQ
ncbi:hypothetical protein VPH35_023266 [Triticum aestivum]